MKFGDDLAVLLPVVLNQLSPRTLKVQMTENGLILSNRSTPVNLLGTILIADRCSFHQRTNVEEPMAGRPVPVSVRF